MSLLKQLQEATVDPNVDISTVLRRALILAARLKNPELEQWIRSELNGYSMDASLPSYRVIPAEAKANILIGSVNLTDASVMTSFLPEELKHWGGALPVRYPVGVIEALVRDSKGGNLQSPWPQEVAVKYGASGYGDPRSFVGRGKCLKAWNEFSPSALFGVIETVRNRLLDFILKIEGEDPSAGEAGPSELPPLAQEKISQIFHTYVYGGVNHIASGPSNVQAEHISGSTIGRSMSRDDLESITRTLSANLKDLSLAESDQLQVEAAITKISDELGTDRPNGQVIEQALRTIRNITEGAIGSLVASAAQPQVWLTVQGLLARIFN